MCGIMNKDNCNKKIYLRLIIYIICVLILYPVMNHTPLFYEYNLFVKIFYIFLIIFILDTIIFDILTPYFSKLSSSVSKYV